MPPNKGVPHVHEILLILAHVNEIFKHLQGINTNSKCCNLNLCWSLLGQWLLGLQLKFTRKNKEV